MSVIVWDGETLAADRRACIGALYRDREKIWRIGEVLVGFSGDAAQGEEVLAWFVSGRDPTKFPESQRSRDHYAPLLIVQPNRTLWMFEQTPYPVKYPPQQFAIGSGRDFALAAMYCGRTARQAVEVAIAFDPGCGGAVDELRLAKPTAIERARQGYELKSNGTALHT